MNETAKGLAPAPFAWLAGRASTGQWALASVVARVLGAGFAFGIALGETYDRTQVVATIVGLLTLASLVPAGRFGPLITGLGAGLLVFAGSALVHEPLGALMLAAGVAGWITVSLQQAARGWQLGATAVGFLGAAGVTLLIAVAVALTVEG